MKAKDGNKYAVVATANKMAGICYRMVRYKQEFIPVDLEEYRKKYNQAKIAYLEQKLVKLKEQAAFMPPALGKLYRRISHFIQ